MIDMHAHILPSVDDGAQSYEEALEMLKSEFEQGVTRVVLTPHVQHRVQKVSFDEFLPIFQTLENQVKIELPEMKLYLGAEVKYDAFKKTDYLKYSIQGTNYILIEFSVKNPEPIVDVLYDLVAKGFQPILAHAERYAYLTNEDIVSIKKDGSLIQVNAGAILGMDGAKAKKTAMKLINEELVDLIASDAHNAKDRNPNVSKALSKISKKFDKNKLKEFML